MKSATRVPGDTGAVMDDLESLLRQTRTLRFAVGVETRFRQAYAQASQQTIRFSFVVATLIYGGFGALDSWCLPSTHGLALALRFGLVCPVLAFVALATLHRAAYRFIQPIMGLASVLSGSAITLMIWRSEPHELGHSQYYVGLILVMMFVYAFIRLRFAYAVSANVIMLLTFEAAALLRGDLSATGSGLAFATNNFFLLGANLIGAFTSYSLEVAARRDFVQHMALETEKAKSDRLLLNILPEVIVERMKRTTGTIADEFAGVSILFADLVNFTQLSQRVSPRELVELLNELFTKFDELVEKRGLEKIKTIGDCYMVAAGVPQPRRDHALAIVAFALDLRDYLQDPENNRGGLEVRIGVNSGPVVAGVIGTRKFVYDLWGDTVNTASRMESHGVVGQIQISRETYELVKDDFKLEYGGRKPVKGKGDMEVWYVLAHAHKTSTLPGGGSSTNTALDSRL